MTANAEIRAHFAQRLDSAHIAGQWAVISRYWHFPCSPRSVDGLSRRSWFDERGGQRTVLAWEIKQARREGLPKPVVVAEDAKTLGTRWRWVETDSQCNMLRAFPWRNDKTLAILQDGFGKLGYVQAEIETYAVDLARQGYMESAREEAAIEEKAIPTGEW